jgi:hypothetical protein
MPMSDTIERPSWLDRTARGCSYLSLEQDAYLATYTIQLEKQLAAEKARAENYKADWTMATRNAETQYTRAEQHLATIKELRLKSDVAEKLLAAHRQGDELLNHQPAALTADDVRDIVARGLCLSLTGGRLQLSWPGARGEKAGFIDSVDLTELARKLPSDE